MYLKANMPNAVVQFYRSVAISSFPLFWGIVMHNTEFETKKNKLTESSFVWRFDIAGAHCEVISREKVQ